jgi:hypothetical protein
MRDEGQFERHAALVDRMAETQGVDLDEEIMRGHLTEDDRTDAVLSCTNCTRPGACGHWLAARETSAVQDAPPEYCRNADLFAFLRPASGA